MELNKANPEMAVPVDSLVRTPVPVTEPIPTNCPQQ